VVIDINCVFEGKVVLADGVTIGPNCSLKNAAIGAGTHIKANSVIEDSTLAEGCEIGPFARLRPGAQLARGVKIGNFVEVKKAQIGTGSKVSHLSYIGDSLIGSGVNVGAGTITCNYDGVNKFVTEIGDNSFIGSNTALVAPVKLGKGTTVGAGSVITRDVADDELAVARGKQRNVQGWERPRKK
jgi:bifunctional UDP-N-acetylglucosamine pyrophosphorylase/glucosamine-1-phosphate N-acetyltransferase